MIDSDGYWTALNREPEAVKMGDYDLTHLSLAAV
jgi:hypothetical protein